jgi:adenylate cyclase
VEILATAIGNLLNGDGLVRTPSIRIADAMAAVVLPCLIVLFLSIRRPLTGIGCAALVFAAWLAVTVLAFRQGYWLSIAIPLAALAPVAALYAAARMVLDRYVTRRLTGDAAALTRFQSARLVEHILKNPAFLDKPARQDVAVVFLDLSGYTSVAEAMGPEWTRDLLAQYHTLIDRDVGENNGYVVSFMGDGAMILFGLPSPGPGDASRAIRAIVRLRQSVTAWLCALPPVAANLLGVRIAGHFGSVVVSRLGPADYQHIAATGDTVNVASRLLEIAKQHQASIVISSDLAAAGEPRAEDSAAIETAEVEIRGRAQPISVQLWR